MFKKVSAVVFTSLMLGALAGCGGTSSIASSSSSAASSAPSSSAAPTPVELKVWGPDLEQDLLNEMSVSFQELHPEWDITFTFGTVSEANLKATLLTDVSAGADVFAFADDQLAELVSAGALFEVQQFKTDVTARNTAGSVASATFNNKLYAYPETADNGYFMYYDSSVLTLEQAGSLDTILDVAESLGKKVNFPSAGGWIGGSFFLNDASSVTFDGTTQTCDWATTGLPAAQGAWNTLGRPGISNADQNDAATLFTAGSIIAAFTGTWMATDVEAALGANYAATKLPTYTNGNNEQVQLGSFTGSKLIGVKSTTAYPLAAHAFANYITNEENQVLRFTTRGLGPSNIAAGQNEAITSNVALAALAAQAPYGVSQSTSVGGSYWTPAASFLDLCYNQDLGEYATLQAALEAMVTQILA